MEISSLLPGEKHLRAAIYARVSTDTQDTENQTRILQEWAERRGFDVLAVYTENESAYRAGHQKELARLFSESRRFDLVLIWALDRLTRQGPGAILQLVQRLRLAGVRVLSYSESWTEAPGQLGELLYAITAWVAQFESTRRSERTKAGLARARAHGAGKRGTDKKPRKSRKRRKRINA